MTTRVIGNLDYIYTAAKRKTVIWYSIWFIKRLDGGGRLESWAGEVDGRCRWRRWMGEVDGGSGT